MNRGDVALAEPNEPAGQSMRWPIRNQILLPVTVILVVAISAIALSSAWLAARHGQRRTIGQLRRLVDSLGDAHFPYTDGTLRQMRGLSGAEFALLDAERGVVASTLSDPIPAKIVAAVPRGRDVASLSRYPSVRLAGERYFAARLPANRSLRPASLLVLYPVQRWREARWEAAWPPLAIGVVTGLFMVAVSVWLSRRIGRRIQSVQELFARINEGQFDHAAPDPIRDELHDLIVSANQLSDQLRQMRRTIQHTERMRLLAQLAGGMAHQLRNAVTGARMAVQLHQRRCGGPAKGPDDSLQIALRQLELTEEHVKGLLALGSPEERAPSQGTLFALLRDIEQLVGPACRHARVHWECRIPDNARSIVVVDQERVRSALLNLVLNGIEAAGGGQTVRVETESNSGGIRFEVSDSGDGPTAEIAESLFEPFVSSKREGVGLGLALARQVADELAGSLSWRRRGDMTVFTLTLPVSAIANGSPITTNEMSILRPPHPAIM